MYSANYSHIHTAAAAAAATADNIQMSGVQMTWGFAFNNRQCNSSDRRLLLLNNSEPLSISVGGGGGARASERYKKNVLVYNFLWLVESLPAAAARTNDITYRSEFKKVEMR